MENMASFPDQRPDSRSANAESKAVHKSRTPVLLAVSAALLLTAFFAVSELATLRGAKAHEASAYLTRELGPPLDHANLVRRPGRNTVVSISPNGFRVERGDRAIKLAFDGDAATEKTYAHGIVAKTDFGHSVVTGNRKKTEQYLFVDGHHGTRTWRWRLDTDGLTPRVGDDGTVGFISGHRLTGDFLLGAPKILDTDGRDISPADLRWEIARRNGSWSLELPLDDSELPTPYIIDPASFNVGSGSVGPTTTNPTMGLGVPASVKLGDLLIAHVTWVGGSNVTATQPGGWTQLDQTRNEGTNVGGQVWYKNASVADTSGGTYTWSFSPNAIATGGIAAYTGIDKSVAPQVSQLVTAATSDAVVYYPAITPSANGAQVISVVGHAKASNGNKLTEPAGVNGTNAERWETANSGGVASELSDYTQSPAAAVNTNGSNSYPSGNGQNTNLPHVAFRIALKADVTAPTSAFSLTSVSPAGSAYYPGTATTIWYRGSGPNCAAETPVAGRCSFKIRNAVSDAGSGPVSSQFSVLGGTSTGWTFTGSTVSTPAGGPYESNFFGWTSGTSSSPNDTVTGRDNGNNSDGGTTLTLANDITAPAVPAPTVPAGYYTTLSVQVTLGTVTDGGSGPSASSFSVQRDAIGLSNGSCGSFTGSWSTITLTGGNDTGVSSGTCYRYREIASDNVGNSTASAVSNTAKVDTSAPSTPTLSFSNRSSNAYYNGAGTLWFRPSASGTFTVTAASTDNDSGIASYTFGTLNSNGGNNFGGSQTGDHFDYTFGASTTAPTTSRTVNSTNGAGTNSTNATYTINSDTTGPAVPAPAVPAGYYATLSVPVSLGTATDTGGSGPNASTYTVQRDTIGLSNGSCGAFTSSWTTITLTGGNDTGVTTGNCYRYRETAADNVGNTTNSTASNTAKVDTSAPSTPTLSFSNLSSNAYYDGASTLWFRPSAGSTFTVTAASTDAESAIGSYTFGTLNSNGGSNWGGSQTGDHFDYTFGASTTAPSTARTVSASNSAGTSSPDGTYSIASDTTPPSVTAPGVTPGYVTSLSVPVTKNGGTDGGSDVDATTSILQRDETTLTNGSCGTFPGSWSTVTLSGGNDTSVLNGYCYQYRELLSDHVGNQGTSATSYVVKVDTQGPTNSLSLSSVSPTGSALKIGSTVYYRGAAAGSFKLTNAVTDSESSPASSATAAFGGTTAGWSHTPSTVSTPAGGAYESNAFDWSAGTTSSPTEVVTGADGAGNTTASATLTFTSDSTAPAGGALTVNGGATYSTNGSFAIDVRTDYSETQSATESGLASSTLTRESATLTNDSCGTFGSSTTIIGTPAQSLGTGCYRYMLTGADNVGNIVSISSTVKVDTDDPSVALTDPGTPAAGSVMLTATASDPSTDVEQVAFERAPAGGSTWTTIATDTSAPFSASWDTTAVSDGLFDIRAVATDTTNHSTTSVVTNRRVDNTAPDTTIGTTPPDPSNDTTPTFTFSSSEPGSTFECRVDSASWSPCASPETLSALGAGSHDFDVHATDTAGNTDSTPASYTWTIDLTPPNTTIDSNPPAVDNDSTPTFAFSADEAGSTFECRIDAGGWTSCTSPQTVSPTLLEGSHTFDVRATDASGNADAMPARYTWTIDLAAPTVAITDPTAYLNASDPTTYVVVASSPNGDVTRVDFYECSNASTACSTGSWSQFGTDNSAPYSASWSTPAFDGPKAIRAVAVDVGANTGEDVQTITIDRSAPSGVTVSYPDGYVFGSYAITTDNGPDADVNASSGVLEGRIGDLAADSCPSYDGAWAPASSPATLASGKCAQYRYRIADNAGNWTTATLPNETKSDTASPSSTLADPGANVRQTIMLTGAASDTGGSGVASVAFQRRPAGGSTWTTIATDNNAPYSTPFDTTTVPDGLYDFRSVATDVAGTAETSPMIVANRRIDNTPPSASMIGPGSPVGATVTLTSSTSDAGSGLDTVAYELAPNGGSFNSQAATWDTTLVADGLYDLHVIATDVAGNSMTSALVTTRVDNTPPALNFTSPASGAAVGGTVSLDATASDASPASPPVSFEYKLHSDPPSAYTATGSAWNTSGLPAGDGLYDLRATATDDAGNDTQVENTNVRVDNVAPSVSITAPAAAINGSLPSPTPFSANADDGAGSGIAQVQFFECSNQSTNCSAGIWSPLGTVASPGPYSVSWPIPAADGNHALAAVATDNAGHPASAIRNVDVDRTSPDTTIGTKPADPSNAVTPAFTFSSNEPGSTFECRIDGGTFAPCTSPDSVSGLSDNVHTFEVRATDPAGNTDPSADTWTWHRDTSDPAGTVNSPGANIRQSVTITSTESDPPSGGYSSGIASVTYEYSSDGATWAPIGTLGSASFDSIGWDTTAVSDGVYQLHVVVRDAAGSESTSTAVTNVRIDNTTPTTSQNNPGQFLRATKTLTGSAADSGSGVDHVDFQRAPTGGGSWTTIATDSIPGDGFQASFDTTLVSDGHYDLRTVAYDVAGNQAASGPVTDRLVDNTAPNATMTNPGPYMRGAVNLTSSTSDPGGANASGVVGVAYEYSTNGGTSWQPTGASFDSTAVADSNVSLHVVATDAAGNTTTSASETSLVDNTKPSTTDNAPSGWQSNPITVTLTPNDAGSGINVTEYSVDGSPTYTVGTSVVIPAPADGSSDGAHTIAYFSVDNAGNIETVKSTTVLIDATLPACASCSAADYLHGTVTLSASPTETGSGIQSVTFEYTAAGGSIWTTIGTDTTGPAPYTTGWNTLPVPDGHYDLRISVTDNANNVTTTNLPDKVVDNTAPDVATVGAPTEGQVVGGTIAISASASDATSPVAAVHFYVGGSLLGTVTTAPFSLNWNTASGPDGAATVAVVVQDMAGNTTTSPTRNVSVDNLSPTPTLADPGQNLSGTIALSASSDPDTAQVDFERRPAGGGSWVTIASDTTTPFGTPIDTTTLADGLYDFRAVATDQTGHSGASPVRSNVRIDNTSPSGSMTAPAAGATVGGPSVALGVSASDAGSGVASVRYEVRPTGGGSFSTITTTSRSPFDATWDATTVLTGSYDLRPVITDQAGNSITGPTITVTVDATAPTVVLSNPGGLISGTVVLNATVSGSGATQVVFAFSPAGGSAWTWIASDTSAPWSGPFDTSKLNDGDYDLRARVSDGLGNASEDVVAGVHIDNTAPRLVSSTPAEGSTVASASSIALTTSEPATPGGVTLDGGTTVAPVVSGTSIIYNTGALAPGAHTLAGELQDFSGKKAPFRVHVTVWSSGSHAPAVEKNTTPTTSTTLESPDAFAAVTMAAGAWSTGSNDWIVLRITTLAPPSGLTNGFGPGPEALDVTAWWALAGAQLHEFAQPIDILMRTTEKGLAPATFDGGSWRFLRRVPTVGVLPARWEDGFFADASGYHVLTKHLSTFALLHDVLAPEAPKNARGFLGTGGLTLRWTPGADNSGTYDFVTVLSGSTDTGRYGVDHDEALIGPWSPGDTRVFRLKETDLAGNASPLTLPLRPVPSLVGKTIDEITALLADRGFTVGQLIPTGSGAAGIVTGPAGLVLAGEGSAIDLTVTPGTHGSRFAFRVVTAPKFRPAPGKKLAARISLTRAARVTAELLSPRGKNIHTWRLSSRRGHSIVKLRIPPQVRRTGIYSLRWTARAGRNTISRRITIKFVRTAGMVRPVQRLGVVLTGSAGGGVKGRLRRSARLLPTAGIDPTFDAAASRKIDVRVIVLDANQFGAAFIRDLHTVFPSVRIVALASPPRAMAMALRAGAAVALPRSTPPSTLARVIQRLLHPPKRPDVRKK
jgi:Bacterial Ig domain/Bacterial Ig-like domain